MVCSNCSKQPHLIIFPAYNGFLLLLIWYYTITWATSAIMLGSLTHIEQYLSITLAFNYSTIACIIVLVANHRINCVNIPLDGADIQQDTMSNNPSLPKTSYLELLITT